MAGTGSNSAESAATESDIELKIARALKGNAEKDRAKIEKKNQLTVRERIALLTDSETFVEDGLLANCNAEDLPADGVVTGYGKVSGRSVCIVANDSTVKAGSWGTRTVEKIIRMTEYALRHELPIFWLIDSAGARITDQVQMFPGRRGAGRIFSNQVKLSGKVPQICCLFGPSAAGGAYIPAFCDVVFMVDQNASMYLGSPRMAQEVIGENVTLEEMGGARMHTSISGCADNLASSDTDAIDQAKMYFSFMPMNWRELPPHYSPSAPSAPLTRSVLPDVESAGYDIHNFLVGLVDEDSFFEVKPDWATELVTGFALLDGNVVGIVANNPMHKGGVLFVDSADKAARFVWLCDAFNISLIFLADVPGFMIGTQVERQGIIRHGAKLLYAFCESTVPRIQIITRKAYGGAYVVMNSKSIGADLAYAWPTAELAVMGPQGAVEIVYRRELQQTADPVTRRAELVTEYTEKYANPYAAAERGYIDDVIDPAETRIKVIAGLRMLQTKREELPRRKHGNTPL